MAAPVGAAGEQGRSEAAIRLAALPGWTWDTRNSHGIGPEEEPVRLGCPVGKKCSAMTSASHHGFFAASCEFSEGQRPEWSAQGVDGWVVEGDDNDIAASGGTDDVGQQPCR